MTTVLCPLHASASQFPAEPAFIDSTGTITYETCDVRVSQLSHLLLTTGLKAGDRVAVISENSPACVMLIMAALRAGLVIYPVSTRLPDAGVSELLPHLEPSAIIAERGRIPEDAGNRYNAFEIGELLEMAKIGPESGVSSEIELARPATIMSTSGSLGKPKLVLHSYGNHYCSALGSNENIAVSRGDRWLLSLPLYHAGGMAILFRTFLGGGSVMFPEQAGNPRTFMVNDLAPTHMSLVSTQLQRLLDDPDAVEALRPDLKAVLLGGGPIPKTLVSGAIEAGLPVMVSYGLTEMASQVTTTAPHDLPERLGSSGRVLAHRAVRVSDDGEILVSGETRFLGYISPKGLHEPFDSDGWFATGDMGEIDADGYLTVHGRRDRMFTSGGENIHPEEIERVLLSLDTVTDAVVVGIPDDDYGTRPAAMIRPNDKEAFDTPGLVTALKRLLPGFKIPVVFALWDDRLADGGLKPDYRRLAEHLARMAASPP